MQKLSFRSATIEDCKLKEGKLTLKEHEAARWLDIKTIDSVEWLPADITLIDKIKERLNGTI